jgi:hypothetical protein
MNMTKEKKIKSFKSFLRAVGTYKFTMAALKEEGTTLEKHIGDASRTWCDDLPWSPDAKLGIYGGESAWDNCYQGSPTIKSVDMIGEHIVINTNNRIHVGCNTFTNKEMEVLFKAIAPMISYEIK